MITLVDIARHIGNRTLFEGVTLTIGVSERIGLVGRNGSGKTTLLEILAGRQQPDDGAISCNKRASVGYLPQEIPKYEDRTLLEEMLAGHEDLDRLRGRLALLEEEMQQTTDTVALEALAHRYGEMQERFAQGGGYDLPGAARQILGGLGFATTDFERPTAEFSGGWLMRLALGRLLLTRPDLMLLDEPTNYLDLHSVIWLESYLRSYDGSIVIVSHDRALLNNIAQRVLEIDVRQITSYTGNYDEYVHARAVREAGLEAARKAQQREITKTKLFIDRFRYKNTKARQVQSRIKQLEKLEIIETSSQQKKMSLGFPEPGRSSRVQIELRGVWKTYDGPPVYTGIDLKVERGERLVLVGPNGAGKSTLMKILAGVLSIDRGERIVGHGVQMAYFAQHRIEALDYDRTILQEMSAACPELLEERLRSLLGRFLFAQDDVFKPIRVLSGGEKARVALAKLLVAAPNLLLVDEPTSHLDIPSRDVLEEALLEYQGTVITISHDRHFIERLSSRVIEAGGGGIRAYIGTYREYVEKQELEAATGGKAGGKDVGSAGGGSTGVDLAPNGSDATLGQAARRTREDRRREAELRQERNRRLKPLRDSIARLEEEIEALNEEIETIEQEMADPDFYGSGQDFEETFKSYNAKKAVVESKLQRWEELLGQLESAEGEG